MRGGIVVAAPCKINLHLRILDRRDDGFHDLESVFQALSFGDELRLESLKEHSVCDLQMGGLVPPEHNSVFKALSAFRALTGFDGGLRIVVEKRVPMGAGLGGGSSDAAAALLALDRLAGTSLSGEALRGLAMQIGSDVPFFLEGGTALVSGRGEFVEPVSARTDWAVVLIHPGFPSDTAGAYRALDRSRSPGAAIPVLGESTLRSSLMESPKDWPFFNDFFPVLAQPGQPHAARYEGMLGDLRSCGAEFVSLSGSGSTCFGVFRDPEEAEKARKRLSGLWNFVEMALPLARSADAVVK